MIDVNNIIRTICYPHTDVHVEYIHKKRPTGAKNMQFHMKKWYFFPVFFASLYNTEFHYITQSMLVALILCLLPPPLAFFKTLVYYIKQPEKGYHQR